MTMYKVVLKSNFKILPWEFREMSEFEQGELMGLVMPEVEYDLEQTAKRVGEEKENENTLDY